MGPAATRALPASLPSYFLKFLMNIPARFLAFSSHSHEQLYVSRGSRMAESTPLSSVGTTKLKKGIVFVGAWSIEWSRMASMMPRVSLMEMRLPVPFQPVLTR